MTKIIMLTFSQLSAEEGKKSKEGLWGKRAMEGNAAPARETADQFGDAPSPYRPANSARNSTHLTKE